MHLMKSDQIYDYLERLANLIRADMRRLGIKKGLQPVQVEALHYLGICNHYSNTPAAVADYLGLTKGTVSQTLRVLEVKGYIEKHPDAKDRRVVHLSLTAAGKELLAQAIPPKALSRGVGQLPEVEQKALVDALNTILSALQRANQLKTFGVCKTCRYNKPQEGGLYWCNLTQEALKPADIERICREHEMPRQAPESNRPSAKSVMPR